VVGARGAFHGGQGLLVHGDRVGGASDVPVGDGKAVARCQGVVVIRAQSLFLVSEQALAYHDGLIRAVGEFNQEPERPPAEFRHAALQLAFIGTFSAGLCQRRDLLHQVPSRGHIVMPGLAQRSC